MNMNLLQFANQTLRVPLAALAQPPFHTLVEALQAKLVDLGLLDPTIGGDIDTPFRPLRPGDGNFGPQTHAALGHFCQLVGLPDELFFSPALALRLHEATPDLLTPMHLDESDSDSNEALLAKRILRFMLEEKKYWVARAPGMFNIVYLEGCTERGVTNDDMQNRWNDRRMVIDIANDQPRIRINHAATTEPGDKSIEKYPKTIAHIAFGQYKAWTLGDHYFDPKRKQPALRQDNANTLRVHRGKRREGSKVHLDGLHINQHSTYGSTPDEVKNWSAGCLVGQNTSLHKEFISLMDSDWRYKRLSKSGAPYFFITTVLDGEEFNRFKNEWIFRSGATR